MFSLYGNLPKPKAAGGEKAEEAPPDEGSVKGDGAEQGRSGQTGAQSAQGQTQSVSSWAGASNRLLAPSLHQMKKRHNVDMMAGSRTNSLAQKPAKRAGSAPSQPLPQPAPTGAAQGSAAMDLRGVARGTAESEEYDPFKPNDYATVLEEKERKHMEAEKASSDSRRETFGDEREVSAPPPRQDRGREPMDHTPAPASEPVRKSEPAVDSATTQQTNPASQLKVSGEEAYERRAKLRMSGEEAFRQRASKRLRNDAGYGGAPDRPPNPPGPAEGENPAAKMMAMMGWKEGKGLGKDAQGITQALSAGSVKKPAIGGVQSTQSVGGQESEGVPEMHQVGRKVNAHSSVILLTNMALPGEVDPELELETAEECSKYGKVESCTVYELEDRTVPPAFAVRIFVKFANADAATKALMDLDGRFFDGRVVRASFFPESKFQMKQFDLDWSNDD